MDRARQLVLDTLKSITPGTRLFVDYVAAAKPTKHAAAAAAASRAAGLAPTHYLGTFVRVEVVGGDPIFYMRVDNRGGEVRCFNPFKGKLRAIQPIQVAA